jgi:hypothetical protein
MTHCVTLEDLHARFLRQLEILLPIRFLIRVSIPQLENMGPSQQEPRIMGW